MYSYVICLTTLIVQSFVIRQLYMFLFLHIGVSVGNKYSLYS